MKITDQLTLSPEKLTNLSAGELRQFFRKGTYQDTTAGLSGGNLQCNLVVLPVNYAQDFELFCKANPVPCPLLACSAKGKPSFSKLGKDIDIRTDLPAYYVYREGKFSQTVSSLEEFWNDDLCAFAIGCSFTFENALQDLGISLRHIENETTVPMFRTSLMTKQAGPFFGEIVVSMRPIKRGDIEKVYDVCSGFLEAHGKPIHFGDPGEIGIRDLNAPQWGAAVPILEDELPVFWGCGVTTQVAVQNARPPISFTHAPGAMLITDISKSCGIKPQ